MPGNIFYNYTKAVFEGDKMRGHNWDHGRGDICKKCGKLHVHPFQNRKHTEEHNRKNSEAHKNKKLSQEHKAKIGKAILKFNSGLSKEERSLKYGTFGDLNPSKREDVKEKLRGPNLKKGHLGDKNCSKRPDVQEKIRKRAKERYSDPEWRKNFLISIRNNLFSVESFEHIQLKREAKKCLESLGYVTNVEHPVSVGNKMYIVDVFGYGKGTVVVECGGCGEPKLKHLRSMFDVVVHVPYGTGVKEGIEKCLFVS